MEKLHISKAKRIGAERHQAAQLTDPFATSLRHALTGGAQQQSFGVPCATSDPSLVSVAQLDEYARSKWESVLGYMVGSAGIASGQDIEQVSPTVQGILEVGGLVDTSSRRAQITKEGFAFVLQETNAQVWKILLKYAETSESARTPDSAF